jgi:hypothetical protein
LEANSEETETTAEHQIDVPIEEAAMEAVGVLKDRYGGPETGRRISEPTEMA